MNRMDLLFSRYDLSAVLQNQEKNAIQAIDSFDVDRLLNTSTDDLIDYFTGEHQVEYVRILNDQIHVDQTEAKIDVSQDGSRAIFDRSRPFYIDGTKITFFVPYEGDGNLLFCHPSSYDYNPPRALVNQSEIQFIYDRTDHDPEKIRAEFDSDIGRLTRYLQWIEKDVLQFNSQFVLHIRERIEWRKAKILKDRGLVSALGFPLKKRADAPSTYVAPVSRRQVKPIVAAKTEPFVPEPTLEMGEYEQILSIISNMVLVMERSPNAFRDMKEEDLRQHFLVQLNGQYEGQATGETFNYQGKTDILIRANDKNIFIAECKFWKGERAFLRTLDQLLGYASWRDTKTAVLLFNRNKNFSDVVNAIPDAVKKHPN